jgi:prepilin-type N-terminal cleavage/methylation domain-containing protein
MANARRLPNATRNNSSSGFSLAELATSVAIIGVLSAIAIPQVYKYGLKLPRTDEAKSILNSAISECLRSIRYGASPSQSALDSTIISNNRLEPLGYKLLNASYNPNCSRTEIAPIDATEDLLYQMGFMINPAGKVVKTAIPAKDKSSLPSCKAWAGDNCGISPELQAEWDRIAKIEADKKACNDAFYTFLNSGSKGQKNVWDDDSQSCSRAQWVLDGTRYTSKAAYDAAFTAKVGKECLAELSSYSSSNPPNGRYTNSKCEIDTYFLNGANLETSDPVIYEAKLLEYNQQQCAAAENKWLQASTNGAFSSPSGLNCQVKWKCNTQIYTDEASYKSSSCAAPPPPQPQPPPTQRVCVLMTRAGCVSWKYL